MLRRAVAHVELPQKCDDVVIDSARRQKQSISDLAIGQALGQQREHIELAVRQVGGIARSFTSRTRSAF